MQRVVNALISADKAGIPLTYKLATAIDLAGRDVFEAVQVSVNPKVITTPKVAAMAKDGIQLLALARVTVRANVNRLVGGAGEETILARVGEGIVSTIGSASSHKAVLENPDLISKTVLSKGLDAGTAFEILSIDIADVDVGKNIGAELQTDQAEADKRIAQAKAEERRALAVAMEQEYKAEAQKQRAKVIAAEAQIPLAMAEAFRNGNLGVMDYQRYRNLQADTTMRQTIAGHGDSPTDGRELSLGSDGAHRPRLSLVPLQPAGEGEAAASGPLAPTPPGRATGSGDPTQREGSRLETLFRELERRLEEAGSKRDDHNFVVNGEPSQLRLVARLKDPKSGRVMTLSADQPGVQFYTGNFLDGSTTGKGTTYGRYSGLCLETQKFPNAINIPAWQDQVILRAGQTYRHVMAHRFSAEP